MSVRQQTFWPEVEETACTLFTPADAKRETVAISGETWYGSSEGEKWVFSVAETLALVKGMRSGDGLNTSRRGCRADMLSVSCEAVDSFDLKFERCRRFRKPRVTSPILEAYRSEVSREETLRIMVRFLESDGDTIVDAPGWDIHRYPKGLHAEA